MSYHSPRLWVEGCGSRAGGITAKAALDYLICYKIIFTFCCFSCDNSKNRVCFPIFHIVNFHGHRSGAELKPGLERSLNTDLNVKIYGHLKGKLSRAHVINPWGI